MKMKMNTIRMILCAAAALLAGSEFCASAQEGTATQALGGVYRKVVNPDDGEMAVQGTLTVIFDGSGYVWFNANLGRSDGHTAILSPENDEWIPAEGNRFSYNYKTADSDYVLEVSLAESGKAVVTDHFLAGGSPFGMGMSLEGEYELDGSYVPDTKGFMYHYISEATELELCAGGRYAGEIRVPESVTVGGASLTVRGVGANAFRDNKAVTEVYWDREKQYLGPSAFYRSGIRYGWDYSFNLPGYIYPDTKFDLFVRPTVPEYHDFTQPEWMLFKHNAELLTFVKDRSKDEEAQWGYSPWHANRMQGAYYEMRVPSAVKKEMFRGYEAQEVIGLVTDSRFIAQHRFPPYSRWKYPEKEQSMSASLEKTMATRYGRTLRQSRYIGHLREEDGRLGIFEFEPKDGEAMVVFAWTQGGKVKATYVKTTEIDPREGDFSVWNVDDDGTYGIPQLICVAFDSHDNVILFFNHPAPESANLFGLRQQGDQLQPFGEDQWYRYVD